MSMAPKNQGAYNAGWSDDHTQGGAASGESYALCLARRIRERVTSVDVRDQVDDLIAALRDATSPSPEVVSVDRERAIDVVSLALSRFVTNARAAEAASDVLDDLSSSQWSLVETWSIAPDPPAPLTVGVPLHDVDDLRRAGVGAWVEAPDGERGLIVADDGVGRDIPGGVMWAQSGGPNDLAELGDLNVWPMRLLGLPGDRPATETAGDA